MAELNRYNGDPMGRKARNIYCVVLYGKMFTDPWLRTKERFNRRFVSNALGSNDTKQTHLHTLKGMAPEFKNYR